MKSKMKYFIEILYLLFSKKSTFQLLFFIFLCVMIYVWILQYISTLSDNINTITSIARQKNNLHKYPKYSKYVLVWSEHSLINVNNLETQFFNLNCSVSNCVFTEDRNFLYDYMRFDAIVFSESALDCSDRPVRRSRSQLYVFSSKQSSYTAPACDPQNDDFFNLTLTYRLDSDVVWSFFAVRNFSGAIVAPKIHVRWQKSLDPVSKDVKSIINRKSKTAAWLVSQCEASSLSKEYLTLLQEHLFHFSLKIDIYGKCSNYKCPNNDCGETIKKYYYFYMAFEDSFAEDYVTDLVVHGYNNYAVPIVYGKANYSRFLPPGSYINAREIHPYNLAYAMHKAIKEPALYETYFRWTNLYTIETSRESHDHLCNLCAKLHNSTNKNTKAKKHFRLWWNGFNGMNMCLSEAYWKENANLNIDTKYISY